MNEIWIYDEIGPDYMGYVSAKYVLNELGKIGKGKPVTVRINTPGGDVIESQAIYNALRRHEGEVTIEVDALAASGGSYIAMAGDKIRMAENSMIMIHKAWTMAMGNAEEIRTVANTLDKVDGILTDTYAARTKMSADKITAMLAAETWMNAQEAVDKGFADEIGTPLNVKASIKQGRYAKTPQRFLVSELPREEKRGREIAAYQDRIRIARSRMGV